VSNLELWKLFWMTVEDDSTHNHVLLRMANCKGGLFGGWSLYVKNNKPKFAYNWLARERYEIEGKETLPKARSSSYDFTYDGDGLHKGGTGVLSINGKKVGEGRSRRPRARSIP
jgi:hypothetical protein